MSVPGAARDPWGVPELFLISQTALPAALYLPGMQGVRFALRSSAFLIPLMVLAWWYFTRSRVDRDVPHPARAWVVAILCVIALMIFHPLTSTAQAGVAHFFLYLAIVSPVFWAPALVRTPTRLRRLMVVLLVCNALNSAVGVLQVYDPGRWLPDEFSRIVTQSELGLGPVSYRGANGETIVRPPGLFDTPGAVAGPGAYAALLGLIFAATRFRWWLRGLSLAAAVAGAAAIYLSHVRVSIVVAGAALIAYVLLLVLQRRFSTAALFGAGGAIVLAGGLAVAISLGGSTILTRFQTLFESDPLTVYYAARGGQVGYALSESLFTFPFGAGLGRWGMIGLYFGRPTLDAPALWAEVQIAAWILDGGVVLVAVYLAALLAAASAEARASLQAGDRVLAACGAAVFAANLPSIALVFTFTPFVTQIGVQYWFLAGALHGVLQAAARQGRVTAASAAAFGSVA